MEGCICLNRISQLARPGGAHFTLPRVTMHCTRKEQKEQVFSCSRCLCHRYPHYYVSNPCFLSTSTSSSPFQGLPKHALRINAMAQKWEPSKVAPLADNVLIRLEELPKKSTGGVLLPAIAVNFDRCLVGEVLSVGAEVGGVKAGAKVLFSDVKAYEVDLGKDARHCFCRASDLMAVVE